MQLSDQSGAAAILGKPYVFLRIEFPNQTAIGPFRMGVLEAVHNHPSIAAAAKARNLTYRRTWEVIQYLNSMFEQPLVLSTKGRRGGVRLTKLGLRVLSLFRASERQTVAAISKQIRDLEKLQIRLER